jgi:hypothetical protein
MLTAWSQETNVPTAGKPYTIGVVMDGECRYFEQLLALVKQELAVLMEDERPVVFKMDPAFNAGWDLDKVNPALDAALQDPEVDLVYANGILVAQAAAQPMRKLNKPVISGFAQDPDAVGLPYGKDGRSTKKNYNFVIVPLRSSRDLEVFHQLVPFKHLVVLMDSKLMMG